MDWHKGLLGISGNPDSNDTTADDEVDKKQDQVRKKPSSHVPEKKTEAELVDVAVKSSLRKSAKAQL
eukprot:11587517-Alexandrium_andersonii.AAC.1